MLQGGVGGIFRWHFLCYPSSGRTQVEWDFFGLLVVFFVCHGRMWDCSKTVHRPRITHNSVLIMFTLELLMALARCRCVALIQLRIWLETLQLLFSLFSCDSFTSSFTVHWLSDVQYKICTMWAWRRKFNEFSQHIFSLWKWLNFQVLAVMIFLADSRRSNRFWWWWWISLSDTWLMFIRTKSSWICDYWMRM